MEAQEFRKLRRLPKTTQLSSGSTENSGNLNEVTQFKRGITER